MSYQVIARKWRPQRFADVVGQEPVVASLTYALRQGRLAPVVLFTGIRGTGKTTLARLLVKAVNCLRPRPDGEPCNECENCVEVTAGRSPDVFEIDGASNNSVDDVRGIRENIAYGPVKSKRKAYIVDEVHMLSKSAFNALLKTLEEPPEHTLFIFATTDPQKIPTTVLSRCQRYDLRRLLTSDIVGQLEKILVEENIPYDKEALYLIAREGEGSMRDAQTLVEQMLAFGERKVTGDVVSLILGTSDRTLTRRIVEAVAARDGDAAVLAVREIYRSGKALERASQDLLELLHSLVLVSSLGNARLVEASDEEKKWIEAAAKRQSVAEWLRLFDFWNRQHDLIVRSDYALMLFEVSALMASAFPEMEDLKSFLAAQPVGATPARERPSAPVPLPPAPAPERRGPSAAADTVAAGPVAGWRAFLDRYQSEEPLLVPGLKSARYDERADGVVVITSKTLEAALKDKKQAVIERFAALSGGRKLTFEPEKKTAARSVMEQEKAEEAEHDARVRQELREAPETKQMEQLGFELKKVGKTS